MHNLGLIFFSKKKNLHLIEIYSQLKNYFTKTNLKALTQEEMTNVKGGRWTWLDVFSGSVWLTVLLIILL
jgi:hypothetical protein